MEERVYKNVSIDTERYTLNFLLDIILVEKGIMKLDDSKYLNC